MLYTIAPQADGSAAGKQRFAYTHAEQLCFDWQSTSATAGRCSCTSSLLGLKCFTPSTKGRRVGEKSASGGTRDCHAAANGIPTNPGISTNPGTIINFNSGTAYYRSCRS
jgi:hypothetical protein